MTNPYPLPRETRESAPIAGDGRATYGPLSFKIWDPADVVALVSRGGHAPAPEAIVVVKVAQQPFDDFLVTFSPALAGGDTAFVKSARVQERSLDVTRGGAISGAALERELSTVGTVLQELRRDVDRAEESIAAIPSGGASTIDAVAGLRDALDDAAETDLLTRQMVNGKADRARTLLGYGIEDAYTRTEVDAKVAAGGGGADANTINQQPTTYGKDVATEHGFDLFAFFNGPKDGRAKKTIYSDTRCYDDQTSKTIATFGVRTMAEGGTVNGPARATLGQAISLYKEGWGRGTAKRGEVDGLYIVVGQDSPRDGVTTDACGILCDVRTFDQVGFVGGIEGMTRVLKADFESNQKPFVGQIGYQIGCYDTTQKPLSQGGVRGVGLQLGAWGGNISQAIRLSDGDDDGAWEKWLTCIRKGRVLFELDGLGRAFFLNPTGAGLNVSLSAGGDGSFAVHNHDRQREILKLDQNGNLSIAGNIAAGNIGAGGGGGLTESTGTWTPRLAGNNGAEVGSYTSSGTFARQGSLVHVTASWSISDTGGASSELRITNMPFGRAAETSGLSGRITGGSPGPLNHAIIGVGGLANPERLVIIRADGTSYMTAHSASIEGTYRI